MPLIDGTIPRPVGAQFDSPDKDYGNHPLGRFGTLGNRQVQVVDSDNLVPRSSNHGRWDGFCRSVSNFFSRVAEVFMSAPAASASKFNRTQKEFCRQFDNVMGELFSTNPQQGRLSNESRLFERLNKMRDLAAEMRRQNPDFDFRGLVQSRAAANLAKLAPGEHGDRQELQDKLRMLDLDQLQLDLAEDHAARVNRIFVELGGDGDEVRPQEVFDELAPVFAMLHEIKGQVLVGVMADPSKATDEQLLQFIRHGSVQVQQENEDVGVGMEVGFRVVELRRDAKEELARRAGNYRTENIDRRLEMAVEKLRAGNPRWMDDFDVARNNTGAAMGKLENFGLLQGPRTAGKTQALLVDSLSRLPEADQRLLLRNLSGTELARIVGASDYQPPEGATPEAHAGVRNLARLEQEFRLSEFKGKVAGIMISPREQPVSRDTIIELAGKLRDLEALGLENQPGVQEARTSLAGRLRTQSLESLNVGGLSLRDAEALALALQTLGAGAGTENGAIARALAERVLTPHRGAQMDGGIREMVGMVREEAPEFRIIDKFINIQNSASVHVKKMVELGVIAGPATEAMANAVIRDGLARLSPDERLVALRGISSKDLQSLISAPDFAVTGGVPGEQLESMKLALTTERARRMEAAEGVLESVRLDWAQGNVSPLQIISAQNALKELAALDVDMVIAERRQVLVGLLNNSDLTRLNLGDIPDTSLKPLISALRSFETPDVETPASELRARVQEEQRRRVAESENVYRTPVGPAITGGRTGNVQQLLAGLNQLFVAEGVLEVTRARLDQSNDAGALQDLRERAISSQVDQLGTEELTELHRQLSAPGTRELSGAMREIANQVAELPLDGGVSTTMQRRLTALGSYLHTLNQKVEARLRERAVPFTPTPPVGDGALGRLDGTSLGAIHNVLGLTIDTSSGAPVVRLA
ncbi:hypothetical protein DB346_18055 [Verrucomicrobia bacterium LW23]|nr:hypothetical protein DB346_18055 [Verrucomicrobia bacterium LW23]